MNQRCVEMDDRDRDRRHGGRKREVEREQKQGVYVCHVNFCYMFLIWVSFPREAGGFQSHFPVRRVICEGPPPFLLISLFPSLLHGHGNRCSTTATTATVLYALLGDTSSSPPPIPRLFRCRGARGISLAHSPLYHLCFLHCLF